MVYFVLIYNWLHDRIDTFGVNLMGAVTHWMAAIALVLVTLWIMFQGYRVLTGQMRESLMGMVLNMARVVVIVSVATTVGVFAPNLHTLVTSTLSTDINQLFTGDDSTLASTIDSNLAKTQLALSAIDTVQIPPGDTEDTAAKARAQTFVIFGTASPPMAAAAMLLLYDVTLALIIGLGPLFIMCLLFEQTKPLFQKWLMYGIGTLFSMGMLAFISSLVLQLTLRVAGALWASGVVNSITGQSAEGFTNQAMQQGGLGLLMTLLVITVPPMAGNFFSATLGNFSPYNVFNRAGQPGPAGQPPGAYGHGYGGSGPTRASNATTSQHVSSLNNAGLISPSAPRLGNSGFGQTADVTKQGGGLANPMAPGGQP
jgi:type IV secretion system protein VirB6